MDKIQTLPESIQKLTKLKMEQVLGKLKNTCEIGKIRKEIARMKTPANTKTRLRPATAGKAQK